MGRNFHFAAGLFLTAVFFAACSFDYGAGSVGDDELPDVVMHDVQYVRVRDGNPLVRFEAEGAERYESRQTMELKNFSFEQFNTAADTVNAVGRASNASVELDSGNIRMKDGVRIEVDSEDITIETKNLEWRDKERQLAAGTGEAVEIHRLDGTSFTGWGFSADARYRTWAFTGGVQGVYIDADDDEEGSPEDAGIQAESPEDAGPPHTETPEEVSGFEDTAK
ncbi:MAG: LPS export ABC transporter periplasmic protein LptC [Treponema sp.]|jgi:LPS export ABC transporter protein LptC|nr:LPS export ABC transporter periplasmic protein LptC [Treponema sp.]